MIDKEHTNTKAAELALLAETGAGTSMGTLLRRFWQPVIRSVDLVAGSAQSKRILSQDFTLYRGESGQAYMVDGYCAHRLTRLHTGWVQGEEIRCIYHGWKYNGAGQCTEMPAEREGLVRTVRIGGYPVHEYGGLIFAWLGGDEAPPFDLPRKEVFELPDRLYFTREQVWPCNWFQQVENSMDAVHVSFVHQKGRIGRFGEAVTPVIPSLEYEETDAGLRQIATRGANNVRVSDWTFPNNNHIVIPSVRGDDRWIDIGVWMVPVDKETTTRLQIYSVPSLGAEADRMITEHFESYLAYNPADHHDTLFDDDVYPEETLLELTSAQDYVAAVGQGAIVDRARERLGASDSGIAALRQIFLRELRAIRGGGMGKKWRRLAHVDELPTPQTAGTV